VRTMAQGPQAFVGEPVVIPALLVLVEPDASEPVQRIGGWHVQPVAPKEDVAVGDAGTVCHPYSGTGLYQRFQGSDQSAG